MLKILGELLFTILMIFAGPVIVPLAFRQGSITYEKVVEDTRNNPGQLFLELILAIGFALGLGIYWHPAASTLPLCTLGWLLYVGVDSFWRKI